MLQRMTLRPGIRAEVALALGLVVASAHCGGKVGPETTDASSTDASHADDGGTGDDGKDGGGSGQVCAVAADASLNGSLSTTQIAGECVLGTGLGKAAAGQPCTQAMECAPACCACPSDSGEKSVTVSYCLTQGACATAEEACCALAAELHRTGVELCL